MSLVLSEHCSGQGQGDGCNFKVKGPSHQSSVFSQCWLRVCTYLMEFDHLFICNCSHLLVNGVLSNLER